ncbi:MAG: hypothetical protein KGH75_13655 [Rhodospirillales bacterium]|nr:hypothetical protein [Rhodospirillales bacterium]
MSTPITTIPNRPAGKPVFDFQILPGFCRVPLATVSNDGLNLVVTGWAYQIDSSGAPVLDPATGAPIATTDSTRTILLSGILAGTHSLYDGWCKYTPDSQTTLTATTLPTGWTSGSGAPTGTQAYGAGYYDTAAGQGWTYQQGCLDQAAQSFADALEAQIDNAAKLSALGL